MTVTYDYEGTDGDMSGEVMVISAKEVQTALVARPNAIDQEDAFSNVKGISSKQELLEPPLPLDELYDLPDNNNTLGVCIDAMEVNIDGTGHSIVLADPQDSKDEAIYGKIKGFFDTPYIRKTMVSIRREVRRDLERTGNSYLEVIRDNKGELAFIRHVLSNDVRLLKLDDNPTKVRETILRNGKQINIDVWKRERRYVQNVGGKAVYFKEFGCKRQISKKTGKWGKAGQVGGGSEIIHLTVNIHKSGYGQPRYIGQIPAILSTRGSEEVNLELMQSGGMPPALVLVQNGSLGSALKQDIEKIFTGKQEKRVRAAVVSVKGTGSLDHPGNAKVTVERFGTERLGDALYQKFDEAGSEKVRRSFRLPPMFVGSAHEYSFASAYASYTVAEAQVFAPERWEFDSVMNCTIVSELDPTGKYLFRSNPLTVSDIENKIKALQLASSSRLATPDSILESVNEAAGLKLIPDMAGYQASLPENQPGPKEFGSNTNNNESPVGEEKDKDKEDPKKDGKKSEVDYYSLMDLSTEVSNFLVDKPKSPTYKQLLVDKLKGLSDEETELLRMVVAQKTEGSHESFTDPLWFVHNDSPVKSATQG